MTTRGEGFEEKKEMNSMQEESDVSNRHVAWWRNACWIRVWTADHTSGRREAVDDSGEQQARDDVEKTQSFAEERRGGEMVNEKERDKPDNAMQALYTS